MDNPSDINNNDRFTYSLRHLGIKKKDNIRAEEISCNFAFSIQFIKMKF